MEKRVRVAAALEQWAAEHEDQLSPETLGEVSKIAGMIQASSLDGQLITDVDDSFNTGLADIFAPDRAERARTLIDIVIAWTAKHPAAFGDEAPADAPAPAEQSDATTGDADDTAQPHSQDDSPSARVDHGGTGDMGPADPGPRYVAPPQPLPQADRAEPAVATPAFLHSDRVDEEDDVRLYGPKRPWRAILGTFVAFALVAAAALAGWWWFTQRDDAVDTTGASEAVADPTPASESTPPSDTDVPAEPTLAPEPTAEPTPDTPTFWAETTPILNSGTAEISASTYAVSASNRAVLTGHTAAITGVVVSDDGRVLTSGADRRLVDWGADVTLANPDVLNVPAPLTVLERTVDQRIIAGDASGNITILNLVETNEPTLVAVHPVAISAATELADGQIAVASVDGDVDVFAVDTPTDRVELPHGNEVTAVVALPDGTVATAAVDGVIRIWSLDGTSEPGEIATLDAPATAMTLLGDGRLAAASVDGAIHVVQAEPGASNPVVLPGHIGAVRALFEVTLADGSAALASGGDDTTVRLWDVDTQSLLRVLEGHGDIISGIDALPDGRLVTTSGDGTGRVWDLSVAPNRTVIPTHDWNISAIHPWNNDQFVTGGNDGKVVLASTAAGTEPVVLTKHTASIVGVNVLQSGDILSLDASSLLRVNTPSGDPSALVEVGLAPGATSIDVRDTLGVVTGHADGSVRFHDFAEEVAAVDAHGSGVNDVVALSSGLVASAGQDMTVRIIDFDNPDQVLIFDLHTEPVDVVIELDDGRIASAGSDGIYVYTVEGLAQDHVRLNGQRSRTISLVSLPNDRLISTGDDGRIRLWDLTSPESEPTTLVDIPGVVNPYLIQADNGLFVAGAARGYVVFTLS